LHFFYVISLLLVGFIVRYDDPNLLSQSSDASASPFVIAINKGGIKVLPSIFNAIILIAVLSVGNSSTYGSSRTITALANIGQAPKIFGYVDRRGRPMVSLGLSLLFGFLAYIGLAAKGPVIFDWLLAISGLSSFFTWGSICLCHIRFRAGWKAQNRDLKEIPFRSQVGVLGSWFGLVVNILCLIAQFYVAVWPVGQQGTASAKEFFEAYLAAPVVILCYVIYKAIYWNNSPFVKASTMDLDTGRKKIKAEKLEKEEQEEAEKHWVWRLIRTCI